MRTSPTKVIAFRKLTPRSTEQREERVEILSKTNQERLRSMRQRQVQNEQSNWMCCAAPTKKGRGSREKSTTSRAAGGVEQTKATTNTTESNLQRAERLEVLSKT